MSVYCPAKNMGRSKPEVKKRNFTVNSPNFKATYLLFYLLYEDNKGMK